MFDKLLYNNITTGDFLIGLTIFLCAIFASKIIAFYMRRALKDKVRQDTLEIIIKLITYSIVVITVGYIIGFFGLNFSSFMVAGGIAGVVLGFASQSIIGNLISGIFLIIERPIKIGDQIKIGDHAGYVEDIRIISTTIRTYDGLYVRIPNQSMFTSNIINFVNHIVRRFEYNVGIRYSDDAEKAITIIREVIDLHPFALKNPKPQIFVDNLGDNAVNVLVRIWSPISEWYSVKMELLWKIKTALETQGIEIAFPQRVVWYGREHSPHATEENRRLETL